MADTRPSPNAAPPPRKGGGSGVAASLGKKVGPLPVWAWAVAIVAIYYLYNHYLANSSSATGTTPASATTAATPVPSSDQSGGGGAGVSGGAGATATPDVTPTDTLPSPNWGAAPPNLTSDTALVAGYGNPAAVASGSAGNTILQAIHKPPSSSGATSFGSFSSAGHGL